MCKILPEGFRDSLFEQASSQRIIVNILTDCFESFGYKLIDPPLVEFANTLGSGDESFKFMDPKSHHMMSLRSDITVQMMRIASTRLNNEHHPLRLAYAGSVLRVKSDQLNAKRQLFQSGIELVGTDSIQSDVEILQVIVNALKLVKIEDICIDLTIPSFTDIIISEINLSDKNKSELKVALNQKDETKVNQILDGKDLILASLLNPQITIEDLKKLSLPTKAKNLVKRLDELLELAKTKLPNLSFSIDPVDSSKLNYHQTIGFSIFSKSISEEIGFGGRYLIYNEKPAVGFTLYIDKIANKNILINKKIKILISPNEDEKIVQNLRDEGKITIYSSSDSNFEQEAKNLDCSFLLSKGNLKSIS